MDVADHIDALEREGNLLADCVMQAGLALAVPTCPGWTLEALLRHLGYVHRWARAYVAEARISMAEELSEAEILASGPERDGLVDWFRHGVGDLAGTLRSADPGAACWTFLPAPSPLAFWARRQAHETAVHRADAEMAGGTVTPFPAALAADGVDELLVGFAARRNGRREAPAPSFAAVSADTGDRWVVHVSEAGDIDAERSGAGADGTLAGNASDLYLFLWNRSAAVRPDALEVTGDLTALDAFRRRLNLRWG